MALRELLPTSPIPYGALGLLGILVYAMTKAIYRLYFHPLAKFPGPKLAALTYWYEMYYDIILSGQYTPKLRTLHAHYGPIMRISPDEVHVSDPQFYNTVFAPSPNPRTGLAPKRHKWIRYVGMFGHPEISAFGTTDHDVHKMRRGVMEKFFAVGAVKKVSGSLIGGKVENMCRRLEEEGRKGSVRIKPVCSCYTTDVISEYAMGRGFNYLNHPTFFPEWSELFVTISRIGFLLKPWPWLFTIMDNIPESIAQKLGPGLAETVRSNRIPGELIEAIRHDKQEKGRNYPSIFEDILNSDLLPEEKSVVRMRAEGQVLIAAGTETTATVLATGIIRILSNAAIEAKLKQELRTAMLDPKVLPALTELEKLPYLSAVIRESLRLGYGVYGRLERISDYPLQYGKWSIPAGTPVAMAAAFMHTDPEIWPDPDKYDPERWVDPKESTRLYRYIVSFSKGSRTCAGIHLAWAELYMGFAVLFRRFDMKLGEVTSEDDLNIIGDWFLPRFTKSQLELKVFVTPAKN